MEIIDNFLDKAISDDLEQTLSGSDFPWYYSDFTTHSKQYTTDKTRDCSQFTHVFFLHDNINSGYYPLIQPIIEASGRSTEKLVRAKANLIYRHSDWPVGVYNLPHADHTKEVDAESLLYYVNDSDGCTVIFEEKEPINKHELTIKQKIKPMRNRLIAFDSMLLHASTPPSSHELRMVINLVFTK
jgi:hypothetical protein